MRKPFQLIAIALSGACVVSVPEDQLRPRAAFDLQCPEASLQVVRLDEETRGVSGCGHRNTYVLSCSGPRTNMHTTCKWVLNMTAEGTNNIVQASDGGDAAAAVVVVDASKPRRSSGDNFSPP